MSENEVLGWIREDEQGTFSSTRFDNLSISAAARCTATKASDDHKAVSSLPVIANYAHYLQEDWRNLLTLITRVEWTLGQINDEDGLPEYSWATFTALDVEHFHVELRSGFDYLAKIIIAQSGEPGQTPGKSYN